MSHVTAVEIHTRLAPAPSMPPCERVRAVPLDVPRMGLHRIASMAALSPLVIGDVVRAAPDVEDELVLTEIVHERPCAAVTIEYDLHADGHLILQLLDHAGAEAELAVDHVIQACAPSLEVFRELRLWGVRSQLRSSVYRLPDCRADFSMLRLGE